GLADFVTLVPGTGLLRLPEALDDRLAAPVNCATATVAGLLRRAGAVRDRTTLIFGAGVLGLTACAMAHAAGSRVVVCEPDPARCQRAEAFGACRVCAPGEAPGVVSELTLGRGADVALELAGAQASVEAALALVRVGATVVLAGTVLPTP